MVFLVIVYFAHKSGLLQKFLDSFGKGSTSTGASGSDWTSEAWNNGKAREFKGGEADPEDSRFFVPNVGDPEPLIKIDGKGIATITGGSPRLSINGPWVSTEITFALKGDWTWMAIHGGSDHHDLSGTKDGTWGGYAQKIYKAKADAGVQKEPTHGTYCRAVAKGTKNVAYTVGADWTTWKSIQKVEGDKIIMEAYMNDTKLFTEEDSGQFPCDNKVHTEGGPIAWLRFDSGEGTTAVNIQIKDLVVKNIGGGTTPTLPSGTETEGTKTAYAQTQAQTQTSTLEYLLFD